MMDNNHVDEYWNRQLSNVDFDAEMDFELEDDELVRLPNGVWMWIETSGVSPERFGANPVSETPDTDTNLLEELQS